MKLDLIVTCQPPLTNPSESFVGATALAASFLSDFDLAAVFVRTETKASPEELTAIKRNLGQRIRFCFLDMRASSPPVEKAR